MLLFWYYRIMPSCDMFWFVACVASIGSSTVGYIAVRVAGAPGRLRTGRFFVAVQVASPSVW